MNSSRNAVTSARDRERDRDEHRRERPEDDQQDDHRREQAERLRGALLDRRELGLAVVLDGHPGRLDRAADGVLDGDDLVAVGVLDRLVELRLGVGDPAVLGERAPAEGVADALDPGLAGGGLELGRLEERDGLLDRRLAVRRVEPLPGRGGEDEVQDRALLGGELRLDEVRRLLRVRAGDVEVVAQAAADGPDEHDQHGDDPDPRRDHPPRVRRAHARPARQAPGREAFVGGAVVASTGRGGVGQTVPAGITIVVRHVGALRSRRTRDAPKPLRAPGAIPAGCQAWRCGGRPYRAATGTPRAPGRGRGRAATRGNGRPAGGRRDDERLPGRHPQRDDRDVVPRLVGAADGRVVEAPGQVVRRRVRRLGEQRDEVRGRQRRRRRGRVEHAVGVEDEAVAEAELEVLADDVDLLLDAEQRPAAGDLRRRLVAPGDDRRQVAAAARRAPARGATRARSPRARPCRSGRCRRGARRG